MTGLKGNYANFQDPLGLVLRMLGSGDQAALSALYREAGSLITAPLDRLLQPFETSLLSQKRAANLPIILVVGSPRSGSTLVYQTLAQVLPVSYLNNLSALFPHAPITTCQLLNPLLRPRTSLGTRSVDFHNFYGNTAGLGAPNDGFHVWNRWLGQNRYTVSRQLSPKRLYEKYQGLPA